MKNNKWIVIFLLTLLLATLACQLGEVIETRTGNQPIPSEPVPSFAPLPATAVISEPGEYLISQSGVQWYLHVNGERIPCEFMGVSGVYPVAGKVYGHYGYHIDGSDCGFTIYAQP